jgi:hypothetical protein
MNSAYSTGFHAQFPSLPLFSPPWAPVVIIHKLSLPNLVLTSESCHEWQAYLFKDRALLIGEP